VDPAWVLSLPQQVAVLAEAPDELIMEAADSRMVFRQLPRGLREPMRRLAAPGETAGKLAESVLATEGASTLARWFYDLGHLARRGWLHLSVDTGRDRLATLVPTTAGPVVNPVGPTSQQPHVLSRFAWMRRLADRLVLESPLSCARVILHDARAAALVHALAQPATVTELAGRIVGLPAAAIGPLIGLLARAGAACEVGAEDGLAAEDADPGLRCWEFHDLLFHTRSRSGRHDAPVGATYPWVGRLEPPPALKPAPPGAGIDLHRPDLERLQREDPLYAHVQEQRQSLRAYGSEPISSRQLGEFLYRVGRVRQRQEMALTTPQGTVRMDFASRPYPAGGGLYELEIFVVVNVCRKLPAGLYHYDAHGHRLEPLRGRNAEVEQLLAEAGRAAGMAADRLHVLLILTARVPRIAWKYTSLAYALVLKHVGVVYQTMYLAATAMGLAPCALGGGDSDLFARAAGIDYYAETSVGEFLLGSTGRQ
jgi:SagB-type dehydrogenase family enzyme